MRCAEVPAFFPCHANGVDHEQSNQPSPQGSRLAPAGPGPAFRQRPGHEQDRATDLRQRGLGGRRGGNRSRQDGAGKEHRRRCEGIRQADDRRPRQGQRRTAQPGRAQETGGRRRRQPDRQGQGDPARPARRLLRPGLRQQPGGGPRESRGTLHPGRRQPHRPGTAGLRQDPPAGPEAPPGNGPRAGQGAPIRNAPRAEPGQA